MRSQELSDGSVDYGQGVIGPSVTDRLLFNHPLEPRVSLSTFPTRAFLRTGAGVGTVALLAGCSGSGGTIQTKQPEQTSGGVIDAGAGGEILGVNTGPVLKLQFPFDGTWYLTSGPHIYTERSGTISNTVKPELDFAPPEVVPCKNNAGKSLDNEWVTASESGTVISVVNPERVVVEDGDGFDVAYEHIKPEAGLIKGSSVKTGDKIGNPGCYGNTTGIHVDISVSKDGVAIPATSLIYSGYSVKEDPAKGNYNGSLIKDGVVKTADGGRCATDKACGGVRNDVSNDSSEVTGAVKTPEAPVPEFVPANLAEKITYKFAKEMFNSLTSSQTNGSEKLKQWFGLSATEIEKAAQALARGEKVGTEENPILYYWIDTALDANLWDGYDYGAIKSGGIAFLQNLSVVYADYRGRLTANVDIDSMVEVSTEAGDKKKVDQWLAQGYDFADFERSIKEWKKNDDPSMAILSADIYTPSDGIKYGGSVQYLRTASPWAGVWVNVSNNGTIEFQCDRFCPYNNQESGGWHDRAIQNPGNLSILHFFCMEGPDPYVCEYPWDQWGNPSNSFQHSRNAPPWLIQRQAENLPPSAKPIK